MLLEPSDTNSMTLAQVLHEWTRGRVPGADHDQLADEVTSLAPRGDWILDDEGVLVGTFGLGRDDGWLGREP